jgi:hypothetical protein
MTALVLFTLIYFLPLLLYALTPFGPSFGCLFAGVVDLRLSEMNACGSLEFLDYCLSANVPLSET